jgi:hypothetical protein
MRILLFSLFFYSTFMLFAQQRPGTEEMMRDMELARRADLMRVLDSAVVMMEKGEYQAADGKMIYVLNHIQAVPTEFCFFFGKNSFFLEKYKQSADWLAKYIQLKGTTGQYYNETVRLLESAENKILDMRKQEVKQTGEILSRNFDLDCGPSGKVICPICKGTTVIVKKGLLGDDYKNCGYCDKYGSMSCDEFNRLLRGELDSKK